VANDNIDEAHECRSFVWHSSDHFHEKIDKWIQSKHFHETTLFVSDEVAYHIGDMARADTRFTAHPADGDSYICHYRKIPVYGTTPTRYLAPGSWQLAWFPGER
jgi:hypothetical protein